MNQSDHILELARHRRVLRAADVREHGWSPQLLIRLHQLASCNGSPVACTDCPMPKSPSTRR
jgi:hypothetical protein